MTAGISCIAVGTNQPFSFFSVAYARPMRFPHKLPTPSRKATEPEKNGLISGGQISEVYDGTAFSTRPTARYAITRPIETFEWVSNS